MKKTEKTNVMRELERLKIDYTSHTYEHGKDAVDGAEVARLTGQDPARVFKTLVCISSKGQHYVFDIPVLKELDLKKCAKAVGEKSIQCRKDRLSGRADPSGSDPGGPGPDGEHHKR